MEFSDLAQPIQEVMKEPFVLVLFAFFYFLPTLIAIRRHDRAVLLLVNFLLGWTLIGWIICLIWAMSTERPRGIPEQAAAFFKAGIKKPARPPSATAEMEEKLASLRRMRQRGDLDDAEYKAAKAKVLAEYKL